MKPLHILSLLIFFFVNVSETAAFDIWGIEIQAQQTSLLSVDADILVYVNRSSINEGLPAGSYFFEILTKEKTLAVQQFMVIR